MFDQGKTGHIESVKIPTILNTIGQAFDEDELQALIKENDPDCKLKVYAMRVRALGHGVYFSDTFTLLVFAFAMCLPTHSLCSLATFLQSLKNLFFTFTNYKREKNSKVS